MLTYQVIYRQTSTHKWIRYFKYGKLHRKDGAAALLDNKTYFWYEYGYRHRNHRPAIISTKYAEYWVRGKYVII